VTGLLFVPVALGAACVAAEAGNQPLPGQVGVAEVIRNRMERRYASDGTVPGTIFRPLQFSCFNTETPWRSRIFKYAWTDPQIIKAKNAWDTAFDDHVRSNVAGGAVLYHTIERPVGARVWPPRWATHPNVVETARIGDHVFYDDRK